MTEREHLILDALEKTLNKYREKALEKLQNANANCWNANKQKELEETFHEYNLHNTGYAQAIKDIRYIIESWDK